MQKSPVSRTVQSSYHLSALQISFGIFYLCCVSPEKLAMPSLEVGNSNDDIILCDWKCFLAVAVNFEDDEELRLTVILPRTP
jgi:hypothetical protein